MFSWKQHSIMKQDLHNTLMPTAAYDDVYHNFANPETRWTHLRMKVKYISESKAYEGRTWEHPQYTTSQKGVLSGITSLYFFFFSIIWMIAVKAFWPVRCLNNLQMAGRPGLSDCLGCCTYVAMWSFIGKICLEQTMASMP